MRQGMEVILLSFSFSKRPIFRLKKDNKRTEHQLLIEIIYLLVSTNFLRNGRGGGAKPTEM